jgi:hypothetical protein
MDRQSNAQNNYQTNKGRRRVTPKHLHSNGIKIPSMDRSSGLVEDLSISQSIFMHQNNNQDREASRIDENLHKERNFYSTICFKKDMSIKLQGMEAQKIQS